MKEPKPLQRPLTLKDQTDEWEIQWLHQAYWKQSILLKHIAKIGVAIQLFPQTPCSLLHKLGAQEKNTRLEGRITECECDFSTYKLWILNMLLELFEYSFPCLENRHAYIQG